MDLVEVQVWYLIPPHKTVNIFLSVPDHIGQQKWCISPCALSYISSKSTLCLLLLALDSKCILLWLPMAFDSEGSLCLLHLTLDSKCTLVSSFWHLTTCTHLAPPLGIGQLMHTSASSLAIWTANVTSACFFNSNEQQIHIYSSELDRKCTDTLTLAASVLFSLYPRHWAANVLLVLLCHLHMALDRKRTSLSDSTDLILCGWVITPCTAVVVTWIKFKLLKSLWKLNF